MARRLVLCRVRLVDIISYCNERGETVFAFKKAERYSVCNSARATSRDFGAFWACQVCAAPFPLAEGKNSCQPVCQPAARLR